MGAPRGAGAGGLGSARAGGRCRFDGSLDLSLELRDGQDKPYTLCTGKPIAALLG